MPTSSSEPSVNARHTRAEVAQLLRLIARNGLPTGDGGGGPIADTTWELLLPQVAAERLGELLDDGARAGSFRLGDRQRSELAAVNRAAGSRVLYLDRLLGRVLERLDRDGIECRVLKGPAHAQLLYDRPALRPYTDVDVMVRGEAIAATVAALAEIGIDRPLPEVAPGFDERFAKGATLRDERSFGVDVHRTFAAGPLAVLIDPRRCFASSSAIDVAGWPAAALAPADLIVHACIHAAIGNVPPRLLSLRDVAEAFRRYPTHVDEALEIARAWRAENVVACALRLVVETWGRSWVPDERVERALQWSERHRGAPVDRAVLALYRMRRAEGRWRVLSLATTPFVARGERLRFVRSVARPRAHVVTPAADASARVPSSP